MAKEKKAFSRDTPKYTSYSDDESSDDVVDYSDLFKGLDELIFTSNPNVKNLLNLPYFF